MIRYPKAWFRSGELVFAAVRNPQARNPNSHVKLNAFRKFPVRIPKGFRPKAQGCDGGATLGIFANEDQPQRGCGLFPLISHSEFPKGINVKLAFFGFGFWPSAFGSQPSP